MIIMASASFSSKTKDIFDISGHVAVVTGASRGGGKAFAEILASKGANLAICSRNLEEIKAVAVHLETEYGVKVFASKTDVTDKNEVEGFMQKTYETFGHIEILINNAAISGGYILVTDKIITEDDLWKTNVDSVKLVSEEAKKYMERNRYGKILNVSSMVALLEYNFSFDEKKNKLMSTYRDTKIRVIEETKAMALEYGKSGITVNAIAPVHVFDANNIRERNSKAYLEWIEHMIIKKVPSPNDIAGITLALASHTGDLITGQLFIIDGGWSLLEKSDMASLNKK